MRPWILTICLALTAACSKDNQANTCKSDLECIAPGTRCDEPIGRCVCATNEACAEDEFCNNAGVCQVRAGCTQNDDCTDDNTYCDLGTGKCLLGPAAQLSSQCGLASHCPYRSICIAGTCQAGCFDDGDCPLGEICFEGVCTFADGICSDDDFCGYGEMCVATECKKDRRGPYCRGCSFRTALNPEPCDDPRNFCLINSAEAGGFRQFCGVDCSVGQACPNGYGCNFVVILTDDLCVTHAQCQCESANITFATRTCTVTETCRPSNRDGSPDPDAPFCVRDRYADCNPPEGGEAACLVPRGDTVGFCTCDTNDDCPNGGTCVGGQCCTGDIDDERQCRVGEARVSGFCTCSTDDDCPRDSCDTSRGACAITGNPCTQGGGECGPIPCVNGGCQIGQNCAPIQGLACSEVGG